MADKVRSRKSRLKGKVAVVTGASRGLGRGIAVALGRSGATVYVTGRSVRGRQNAADRPETIDDTAERVTASGGTGVAVRCDHTHDGEVESLFARVKDERGPLD
ncbi:MAG: SDR family NAD(P)-dependent oxidoreductase, partial [Euryarchaeota archaeon]|nr:SDR family NAD(P)-dependent oxidoreductase [Euryarchaeota archaeon]